MSFCLLTSLEIWTSDPQTEDIQVRGEDSCALPVFKLKPWIELEKSGDEEFCYNSFFPPLSSGICRVFAVQQLWGNVHLLAHNMKSVMIQYKNQ